MTKHLKNWQIGLISIGGLWVSNMIDMGFSNSISVTQNISFCFAVQALLLTLRREASND